MPAQTASPFLAFGDSEANGPLKAPARDRGGGAVERTGAATRRDCVVSSGASLSNMETAKGA